MEGDESDIFSKALEVKLLFLLKMKNKTQDAQISNNGNLEHIHRLSGPIPEVKHSALINNFENIIAYREKC